MENKYKENFTELLEENHANIVVLLNNLIVKDEEGKRKKFNAKWIPPK